MLMVMGVVLFCPFPEMNTTKILFLYFSKNKEQRGSEQKNTRERRKGVIKTVNGFDTQYIVWLN